MIIKITYKMIDGVLWLSVEVINHFKMFAHKKNAFEGRIICDFGDFGF